MVEIKNIKLVLKHETVLDDVSYSFNGKTVYGIKGRNGCGKSVLMSVIAGLVKLDSGVVTANGAVLGKDRDFPENIGALINEPGMLGSMSGFANLKSLAEINNKISDDVIKDYMVRFGLDPDSHKHVRSYSMGMKQKLGIIAAVMEHPDIILLDEPTNALDSKSIEILNSIIAEEKKRGALVIMTSHDYDELKDVCDIILGMEDGKLSELHNREGH